MCWAGSRSLLKLSQPGSYWKPGRCWQAGKDWERCRRQSGVGGYVFLRITVWSLMATFDNLYKKCYNKRSDNNTKGISHQTGKFAL